MKYKDLNVGDWFTCVNKIFIKTILPSGEIMDFCLSPDPLWFGKCFAASPDNNEVEFISHIKTYNPNPDNGRDVLTSAPTNQFLVWEYRDLKVIFFRRSIQRETYTLALNSEVKAGVWEKSTTAVPVRVCPQIDIKFPEKT